MACESVDIGDKDRERNYRGDEGGKSFEIPDIKKLSLEELNKDKGCDKYENHTSISLFGKYSPTNPIVNCIAFFIDKGLEPLCSLEKEVEEETKVERDSLRREELEVTLEEISYEKEIYLESLYDMSDDVYDVCEETDENIEEGIDKLNRRLLRSLVNLGKTVTVTRECNRIYGVIDSKISTACRGLDISKYRREK